MSFSPVGGHVSDTKFRVVNLVEGSQYAFRVKAVNKVGESEPLEGTETIKMKSKWSKHTPDTLGTLPDIAANARPLRA